MAEPMEKKAFQNGVEELWDRLDDLDADSTRRIIERVADVRKEIIDRLTAIPHFTGISGEEVFSPTYLQAYAEDLRELLARWAEGVIRLSATDLATAAQLGDDGYRQLLTELSISAGTPSSAIRIPPLGLSSELVQAASLYTAAQYRSLGAQIANKIAEQVQMVAFGGQSRWEAIRAIRSAMADGPLDGKQIGALTAKAARIERTALNSVFNAAAAHAYRGAEEELPGLMKEWTTARQRNVCPLCKALEGKRAKVDAKFSGGYFAPPRHFNCVVEGTRVASPAVSATMKRRYFGELIEIRTAAGSILTVTKNHPILSDKGWIPAYCLREGGHVVRSFDPNRVVMVVSPDDHYRITLIEDILKAFNRSFSVGATTVPASAENFHGDGLGSEVEVIRSDGFLWSQYQTASVEPSPHQDFVARDVVRSLIQLSSQRTLASRLQRTREVSFSGISGRCVSPSLFRSPLLGHESVVLEPSSPRDANHVKSFDNNPSWSLKQFAELEDRHPGLIVFDEVIQVRSFDAGNSTHVYNLETSTGWYVAEGIISHNCRCRVVAWMPGW